MKSTELIISDIWPYLSINYSRFIGITEIIDNAMVGRPGITLNFYKPDETIFIHIPGQKNRDNIVDLVYSKVNKMFETSQAFRTANPIFNK